MKGLAGIRDMNSGGQGSFGSCARSGTPRPIKCRRRGVIFGGGVTEWSASTAVPRDQAWWNWESARQRCQGNDLWCDRHVTARSQNRTTRRV